MTDLRASKGVVEAGLGPIAQALEQRAFDQIVLLWNLDRVEADRYVAWLTGRKRLNVTLKIAKLSGPTDFGDIYRRAVEVLQEIRKEKGEQPTLTFHLSSGTPAMASVWIILAKTRFPAELIESSKEFGVKTAAVPFDISAEFLPDLLRKPDEELVRLSQGLPPEAPEFSEIVHRCAPMKHLIAKARMVAPRSLPVLLLGESGTGKEMLARAIHNASLRKDGPFVPVNCGAIPQELLESELFGHEKGAFTGAHARRIGHLESAHNGTLFLDELGELPLPAQVKLLRVLQEKEVVRVGGEERIKTDFRVIAATNRDLRMLMSAGRFREDLFHRVGVAILTIPPVREREGDLSLLIDHALSVANKESAGQPGFHDKHLSAAGRSLLLQQPWTGNVRELQNALRRAAVWSSGATIQEKDVQEALLAPMGRERVEILGRPLGDSLNLNSLIAEVARHYLQRALDEAKGNKTAAAKLIGLSSYQTLTNWLQRYDLDKD